MPRLTVPRTLLAAFLVAAPGAVLPASPAEAATHQVLMSGYAFSPRSLTITAGDTVTWTNQDQAPHDVKTTSGPASIHSPMLNKGGSWSHTFTTAGTYGYVCTVHPDMTAQLVVKPAAAPAPTQHQHQHQHPTTSAPPQARTTRPAASAEPSPHMSHSEEPSSAEAAVPASPDTPSPSASAATQPASIDAQAAASAARPLDPLLLLTGVIAGVAVLCLLLVGSRAAARGEGERG
ncbi:cupredoxin domain-containing protein [Streptomyces justiciae]|uniref:cupredoxin domain-containing protein n=1 Tax=Streptomyces justiciae TaxID=2780140 RepID=UPI002117F4C2|nr:plastocyanin/azurin family copper-binding protein [Streptomyces justiciae]MCW8379642.1 plastocyanin/azurin family copper-binding protein [Streptomyces justiciae]